MNSNFPVRSELEHVADAESNRALAVSHVLALVAVAALAVACDPARASVAAPSVSAAIEVNTEIASERVLPQRLEVSGSLEADASTDIAPAVDGRITDVFVERGQEVRAGDVLFTLDARDAQNRLAEACAVEAQAVERLALKDGADFDPERTADVREARVTMERAELEYQRYAHLIEKDAVSRSDHDVKKAAWLEAKERHRAATERARESYRGLEAQRARVALAAKALEDMQVRAPFAGRVMDRSVDVGQYVRTGNRLATLVRIDPLRVHLEIPEVAAASVKQGGRIEFRVQTRPGRTFEGRIAFVAPGLDSTSRTLIAEALVDNAGGELQPGSFATAAIEVPGDRPCVLVPSTALNVEDGVRSLYVAQRSRAERRFVQVGRELDGRFEIVRGLVAGETVIVQGIEHLTDGANVVARAAEAK